jgi:hypothetical protein
MDSTRNSPAPSGPLRTDTVARPCYTDLRDGLHLYAIQSSCGWVKIGRGNDVERRLRTIASMCPPSIELTLLEAAANLGPYESAVHDALNEHRAHGEWFAPGCLALLAGAGGLAAFVATLNAQPSTGRRPRSRASTDRRGKDGPRWTAYRAAKAAP